MRNVKLGFFFVCRALGLFWIARRLTRGNLKILCYHGFELRNETDFRPKLYITQAEFDQRLNTIRRLGHIVLPLNEAVERMYARSLPENAVVLTIDDGFHSTQTLAVPSLQRFGFPATVYVTSYYVEKSSPIFRLVVQYMFFMTEKRTVTFEDVAWCENGVTDFLNPGEKERAMEKCIDFGEGLGAEESRRAICEKLGELLGTPYADIVHARLFNLMTPDQLRMLKPAGVDVELHTHRHTFSTEHRLEAEREIAENRAALKQWVDTEPSHFCYPSGVWSERQSEWLDGMHVKSSTTCLPGLNDYTTPKHALRRFLDGSNIHPLEFEAALSGFSDLMRSLGKRARAKRT
jgi:peptidoglycan/xylan/chitin deacetylase (PgdA/CDA1 family)